MSSMIGEQFMEPSFRDAIAIFAVNNGYVIQRMVPTLAPSGQVVVQKITAVVETTAGVREAIEEFVLAHSEIAAGVVDSMAQREAKAIENTLKRK